MKDIDPFLVRVGSSIRYSGEQKSAAISNMSSLAQTFGYYAHFFTFSMDDTNESLTLRFTLKHVNNIDFPATPTVNIDGQDYLFGEVNCSSCLLIVVCFILCLCSY